MEKLAFLLPVICVVVIVVVFLAIILTSYVKAPPDEAYIISGAGKKKILIGKAGIKIPVLHRIDKLLLRQVSVDIKTDGYIPTKDFIGVNIDAIAKVAVMSDNEFVKILDENGDMKYPEGDPHEGERYRLVPGIELAMKNFLNMDESQIVKALTDSLQGNMREIIGTMELKVISSDRKAFGDQVQEKAQSDMNSLGIKIISCNIQSVKDEKGLINALGQDNMSQIQKNASIAKAEAERDIAIKSAETEKQANDAKVAAALEIAQRNNELALRQAELKKIEDTKMAEAEAAYDIQKQIQQREINTETVNAQIAQAERETDLKERQIAIKERELDAVVKKQADADRYKTEQEAQANLVKRQKEAEAAKFEEERKAEAEKAKADAARYAAEQQAAGIAARGQADAEAIRAKGLAEATAMEQKAEAYRKYNGAAVVEMMIKIMPAMAEAISKPLGQIDKINIYGTSGGAGESGDGLGTSQISGVIPVVMRQVFDTMSEATGVSLTDILRANTYDAKVNHNINVSGVNGVVGENKIAEETTCAEDVKNVE